jgi:hypothetical protein
VALLGITGWVTGGPGRVSWGAVVLRQPIVKGDVLAEWLRGEVCVVSHDGCMVSQVGKPVPALWFAQLDG